MKKAVLLLVGLVIAASLRGQESFSSPADTVYLKYGFQATVHVKTIEPSKAGSISPYLIKTRETLNLEEADKWTNIEGGYRWTAEKILDGFRSSDVQKVVFADGFVLPFVEGRMDRRLLLVAPSYNASVGEFKAKGVIPLTREETRTLIGDEAYYLGYKVAKNQVRAGLVKMIAGAASGFACYLTRGYAITEEIVPESGDYIGSYEYRFNPVWQTGTAAAAVTTAYGILETALGNGSISRLASSFRDYKAPSIASFRTKALLGGGLVLAGGAVTYLGYDRIAKDSGWSESYKVLQGMESPVKAKTSGSKMAVPWLLPAAGALLANFGLTELTGGLTGLSGYAKLRAAGLARAEFRVAPAPYGMGVSMVF